MSGFFPLIFFLQNSTSTIFYLFMAQSYTVFDNILDKHRIFMIFYTVIYVTLINLTEKGLYSSTVTKEISIALLMSFKKFNFGKSKYYFVEIKASNICYFPNVNMYRYSYAIKTDNYFSKINILLQS